jgi:all-trans-retinol 13,14-reductase
MSRRFDAIVIGSGLGGLTAGALYARTGRRVLVLERNETFGGAATVYQHGPLAIEASLHEIDGLDRDDPKLPVLQSLGLDHDLEFVDVGDLYEIRGPLIDPPFVLPHGVEAAISATSARFPHHAPALREYFGRIVAARAAAAFATRHQDDSGRWWLTHAPEAVRRLWPLIREGRATVSEVLQELFGADEAVKLAVAANLAYYHDDPERMLFLRYAIPQASYLLGGGHYVRGGSIALSNRLVALIREADGTVEIGREANTLLLEGCRVVGVGHRARNGADPQIDFAPVVFGNAAPNRLAEMLPDSSRDAFLASYGQRRVSISLWTISIGLGQPPCEFGVERYSTFILPAWMKTLAEYRQMTEIMAEDAGARLPFYAFVDYARIGSGLNQGGPFLGSFAGIDRLENWTGLSQDQKLARKERWMDRIIGDLDQAFPGIAGAVIQREMATAQTMHHYLNTPGGAVYGFAPEAIEFTPKTTMEGLWIASAFCGSGGFTGAMLGGAAAARAAIREIEPMTVGKGRPVLPLRH